MRQIFRHLFLFIALFFFTAASYTTVFLFHSTYINQHLDAWSLEKDNHTIYLRIQHETDPRELPNNPETLQQFLNLYSKLSQFDQTAYYEKSTQPLYTISGAFFDQYNNDNEPTDQPCWTACTQISENVQNDFNLTASSGRLLCADDFHLVQDEPIPVLMGNSYASLYQLRDEFDAEYLFQTFHFIIVGFLQEGNCIETSNGTIFLDRAIVMPSFICDTLPQTADEYTFQKIHYANKVSGVIRMLPEQYDIVYTDVTDMLSDSPLGEFSWYSSQLGNTPILWGMNLHLLLIVSGIACIFLFVCILLLLFRLIQNNTWKKTIVAFFTLSIIMICGFLFSFFLCSVVLPAQINADSFYYPQYGLLTCAIYIIYTLILLHRKKRCS